MFFIYWNLSDESHKLVYVMQEKKNEFMIPIEFTHFFLLELLNLL